MSYFNHRTTCPDHQALHRFMTPPIGPLDNVSIEDKVYPQLQYQWHQRVAVRQLQYWWHPRVAVRQHINEQLCNQWSNYVQYLQTGLTIAHTAQSPTTNTKATTVHIKDWWVHPMKLRKVCESKSLCRITNPLLTASMNTKYLRLWQLQAQSTSMDTIPIYLRAPTSSKSLTWANNAKRQSNVYWLQ